MSTGSLHHHIRRMTGRDPHERGRAANTLELLFDLVFVISFAQAANGLANLIHHENLTGGLIGFGFAMFAGVWAWINYSWFSSAFDTDDWLFRAATLLQMVGVVIFAVSIPQMFASLEPDETGRMVLDNTGMVLGYVVMRVAMLIQWLRVAVQNSAMRQTALRYAAALAIAQVGWVVLAFIETTVTTMLVGSLVLYCVELLGPVVAERHGRTPWHAHHIAERYGLLLIIALGEGVVGTEVAVSAALESSGWSPELLVLALAGLTITFSLWWLWFLIPTGEALHARPGRVFAWGYGHIVIYAAIAAIGAGLHVGAYAIEDPEHVASSGALLAIAVPLVIALVGFEIMRSTLIGWAHSRAETGTMTIAVVLIVGAVAITVAGAPFVVGLVIIAVAPAVQIVADELWGHRSRARALERVVG
ncbi:low temperature requirement protein A [Microbacterium halotolerans]|uniref:low temperature requirement protein A n=1 Tax=Microbacterium halotolerans TaxID=246613 RepID=UPI0019697D50|nr:low temperature requirement protein A [Microbacterium halotolerans]